MGRLGFFHRSSEARCHLDKRSFIQGGSDIEYASYADGPLIPSPKQWLQCCHSRAELDHQWRVPLRAR